ncbi:MAG: undecaprenyl-diphosphate phosphatase [Gemmatimonadota bacterium]
MNPWEAAALGFIQGATEFLPVSSSGHLVVAQEVLGIHVHGVLFEVTVHVATLLSVLIVYRRRIVELLRGMAAGEAQAWRYAAFLVLATIPAGVVGIFWKDAVEALFESAVAPGIALLVTGTFLWTARWAMARSRDASPAAGSALAMGVAQAFALIPGLSRSGSTVVTGLWMGVDAREAAAFSFLMAVPAIAGAAVLQIPELGAAAGPGWIPLLVGGVVAAVTGVLAIRFFVEMLDRRAFHLFAPYCWVVGGGYLLWLAIR